MSSVSEQRAPLSTIERLEAALEGRARKQLEATRRATVCVILRSLGVGGATQLLLIERTRRPDDPWSGQMALPGGRVDEGDESLLAAARREALEEVGLDLVARARLIGVSDDQRAMARGRALDLVITPFVFELSDGFDEGALTLQEEEVASLLWAPFEAMASGRVDGTYTHNRPGKGLVKLPCYEVGGKVIWGLTFMMLRNLFTILEQADAGETKHT